MLMPSMHVILDVTEDMLHESCPNAEEWDRIERQLYMPSSKEEREAVGWGEEEQLASFDAFMSALG